MTPQEKAENAIKWIDGMPRYRQCKKVMRKPIRFLGMPIATLYCAMGTMYAIHGNYSSYHVGLLLGSFRLIEQMNDVQDMSLKAISATMQHNPHTFFETKVADILHKHYNKQTK